MLGDGPREVLGVSGKRGDRTREGEIGCVALGHERGDHRRLVKLGAVASPQARLDAPLDGRENQHPVAFRTLLVRDGDRGRRVGLHLGEGELGDVVGRPFERGKAPRSDKGQRRRTGRRRRGGQPDLDEGEGTLFEVRSKPVARADEGDEKAEEGQREADSRPSARGQIAVAVDDRARWDGQARRGPRPARPEQGEAGSNGARIALAHEGQQRKGEKNPRRQERNSLQQGPRRLHGRRRGEAEKPDLGRRGRDRLPRRRGEKPPWRVGFQRSAQGRGEGREGGNGKPQPVPASL